MTADRERPENVQLATTWLAINVGLAILGAALSGSLYRAMGRWPFKMAPGTALFIAFRVGVPALIWYGFRWARRLYLFVVGLLAMSAIRGGLAAVTMGHTGTLISLLASVNGVALAVDFYVAWLLIEPDTAAWFRRGFMV